MYHAEVLADSVSPQGHRLTTMLWTFPRFILAEVNTHKMISKCSASSRAIPVEKRIEQLRENPFVPEAFSKNQKGMQASEELDGIEAQIAKDEWLEMARACRAGCGRLAQLKTHKQHANRPMEWFAWHTAILSGTDWDNLFAQRCHPDAQPEFRKIAEMARAARNESVPRELAYGEWHMPFVGVQYGDSDFLIGHDGKIDLKGELCGEMLGFHPAMISAARCARVSYLSHDGTRSRDLDLQLYNRLVPAGHMSPLENPARPMTEFELEMFETYAPVLDPHGNIIGRKSIGSYLGNFNGWVQLRKTIPGERIFGGAR